MIDEKKAQIVAPLARRLANAYYGINNQWDKLSVFERAGVMADVLATLEVANHFELIDLLLDCWVQFALRDDNGGRFHGSLSILEDLESMLSDLGLIDENGLLESERAALEGGEGE